MKATTLPKQFSFVSAMEGRLFFIATREGSVRRLEVLSSGYSNLLCTFYNPAAQTRWCIIKIYEIFDYVLQFYELDYAVYHPFIISFSLLVYTHITNVLKI